MPLLTTITRAVGWATDRLPLSLGAYLKTGSNRYRPADIPSQLTVPESPIRVLIAPTNSAGQAWHFARALDSRVGIGARNFQIVGSRDFGFPADGRIDARLSAVSAPGSGGSSRPFGASVMSSSNRVVHSSAGSSPETLRGRFALSELQACR